MKFFDYLEGKIDKSFVVAYTGRFCPPHNGHISVFKKLQAQFGADKVYIITSDKSVTSPFSFQQKAELFSLFGIDSQFVKKMESSGYNGPAIMNAIGKDLGNGLVVAIGEKDKDRLKIDGMTKTGKATYFKTYHGSVDETAETSGYVYVIKNEMSSKKVINASEVREAIQNNNYKSVKEYLPEEVFNKAKEMMG